MKVYNKLVRDNIPSIMTAEGKNFRTHIATDEEYSEKLNDKLLEEVKEFLENPCLEELVDILEVIAALTEVMGLTEEEVFEKINHKSATSGDFTKKIILESVEE